MGFNAKKTLQITMQDVVILKKCTYLEDRPKRGQNVFEIKHFKYKHI